MNADTSGLTVAGHIGTWHTIDPVSYTHLDVYKRQTKKIAKELLDKGWCHVTGLYTPKKPQLYDCLLYTSRGNLRPLGGRD